MFKFRIDPRRIDALEAQVKKDVKDILAQPAVVNEVGKMTVERLKFQARTEKPFNEETSFPLLRESTIRQREYLERYNKTHSTFDSGRSNLTITGAFQESLTFQVKGPGLLELFFAGMHPRYKGKNGLIGKEVKNEDLFKWLTEKGFKLFDQSIQENRTLRSRIRSIVLRYIRRGLKVRNS